MRDDGHEKKKKPTATDCKGETRAKTPSAAAARSQFVMRCPSRSLSRAASLPFETVGALVRVSVLRSSTTGPPFLDCFFFFSIGTREPLVASSLFFLKKHSGSHTNLSRKKKTKKRRLTIERARCLGRFSSRVWKMCVYYVANFTFACIVVYRRRSSRTVLFRYPGTTLSLSFSLKKLASRR